jgi:HEAT repeat protein
MPLSRTVSRSITFKKANRPMPAPILLTDAQIQNYLINGYTTVQTAHSPTFHQSILHQIETLFATTGNPGNDILPKVPDLNQILQDPAVHGALASILGPDYIVHPHRHCHHNPKGSKGQGMHQDSYENDQNVRHHRTRWTMAFYYPQDVSLDIGPTAILPATQYYNSAEQAHKREEQPLCGQAGTVTIVHYDLWHRAMPNASDRDRYMVKFLFARMSEPQGPSWNCRNSAWNAEGTDPPADLCRRAWDWMRGAEDAVVSGETPLDELERALAGEEEANRLQAAYALAARRAEAVPLLLNALGREAAKHLETNLERDHTNPSQLDAVFALSAVGHLAVPHVAALLASGDWWLRAAAASILGDLGEAAQETVPQLAQSLDDESTWVRRNAVEALGNIGPLAAEAVPALSRRLQDPESWIRHNAALALAKIGPLAAEAIPTLQVNIDDDDRYARANAAVALERIGAA